MNKFLLKIFFLFFLFFPLVINASGLEHLAGRIVLQVEKNGEAWYVSPENLERFFLGRPSDAFSLMRERGIGISDVDLEKIPIALDLLTGLDSDQDGLPDEIEKAIKTDYLRADSDNDGFSDWEELKTNHDPRNNSALVFDSSLVSKNLGQIFLQVEERGQAWYVFPGNSKRYYLGRPQDAFSIMRNLGLGISNDDLNRLTAMNPDIDLKKLEKKIHDLVNEEREKFALKDLILNKELSKVARRHSYNLARENKKFTGLDALCSYPLIHHEGTDFGLYQNNRLASSDINYYNMSGENIALLSSAAVTLTYQDGSIDPGDFEKCKEEQTEWDKTFKETIENEVDEKIKLNTLAEELQKRERAFVKTKHLEVASVDWQNIDELATRAVEGWMNSPGHRKNILKAEYNEAGMGVASVNSYVIITQVFIRKTNCGYIGAPCCKQGKYLICYQPNTCTDKVCN